MSDTGTELAVIQQTLSTDFAGYSRDRGMQARHLELIQAGLPSAEGEKPLLEIPTTASPLERAAADKATGVLAMLDPTARAAMESKFNALPASVIAACRDELAASRPPLCMPASSEFVQRFAASPRGRVLAREWGAFTATRLGRIEARLDRLMDAMPDEASRAAFSAYMRALSIDEARALFLVMGR